MSLRTIRAPLAAVACIVLAILACGDSTVSRVFAADPASGIFLIAKREMRDPRFRETVLLVTQPRSGGPFGVIVNRPLRHRLAEVFPDEKRLEAVPDVLFLGGPVSPSGVLFLVRTQRPPERAVHVLDDVWLTGDRNWIVGQFERPEPTRGLRAYAGYAGWAPGQLQNELKRGDWYVLPADADTIFAKDLAHMWHELVERASRQRTRYAPRARSRALL